MNNSIDFGKLQPQLQQHPDLSYGKTGCVSISTTLSSSSQDLYRAILTSDIGVVEQLSDFVGKMSPNEWYAFINQSANCDSMIAYMEQQLFSGFYYSFDALIELCNFNDVLKQSIIDSIIPKLTESELLTLKSHFKIG